MHWKESFEKLAAVDQVFSALNSLLEGKRKTEEYNPAGSLSLY